MSKLTRLTKPKSTIRGRGLWRVKANDATGQWDVLDNIGHICSCESEGMACLIVRAVNDYAEGR